MLFYLMVMYRVRLDIKSNPRPQLVVNNVV